LAWVGHSSGSGKSTLVNLICRFDVRRRHQGRQCGRSYAVADYRPGVDSCCRSRFLFFGTIAENIARQTDATAEIGESAARLMLMRFILRLPQGYDSMVGGAAKGLSGGERQRISIARVPCSSTPAF
jgi:ATP-binding cassette subfamily B protein IrtA